MRFTLAVLSVAVMLAGCIVVPAQSSGYYVVRRQPVYASPLPISNQAPVWPKASGGSDDRQQTPPPAPVVQQVPVYVPYYVPYYWGPQQGFWFYYRRR